MTPELRSDFGHEEPLEATGIAFMSFFAVLKIIGTLQLASSCAVAVYAFVAWRREPPAPKIPTQHCSVPQTVKLPPDLQRLSDFPQPWKLRSPLAKAEEELYGRAEVLPQIDPGSIIRAHRTSIGKGLAPVASDRA
jgi:hypothetical protein